MLHLLAKWNHSVSEKKNSPSRKCRQKDLMPREFFVRSEWEKAHEEAAMGYLTHGSGYRVLDIFSLWRMALTPDYKCAKTSISSSVSRSKFPPCHKCAFLKHTNIIFGCFRSEVVCNLRDFFPLPVFYTDFFLKVRKSLFLDQMP